MSVFNGEIYLNKAIDSILNQTFSNFEILIINDCSIDSSREIILSYGDPRIRLVDNTVNLGLTNSLNRGLGLVKGEYIARQDADDISIPDRLERQVDFLAQNANHGLVASFFTVINTKGKFVHDFHLPLDSASLKRKLLVKSPFAHGSVMLRKICVDKAGPYRSEFRYSQDYDLWLRMSAICDMAVIPKILYQWRLNVNSISVGNQILQASYAQLARQLYTERQLYGQDRIQKGEFDEAAWIAQNHDPKQIINKQQLVQGYNYQGVSFLLNDNPREAIKLFRSSLCYEKFSPKTWALILLALLKDLIPRKLFGFLLSLFSRLRNAMNPG